MAKQPKRKTAKPASKKTPKKKAAAAESKVIHGRPRQERGFSRRLSSLLHGLLERPARLVEVGGVFHGC